MEEQKLLRRKKKAKNEKNETVLVDVCTNLANLYVAEGRYGFAIEEFLCAAKILEKQKKFLEYAVINRGIGEAFAELNDLSKALKYQKIYLEISKQLKNKAEEQRALATIGHLYLTTYLDQHQTEDADKRNLQLANEYFQKSLSICESLSGVISKTEIADMSARLFSNLGLVEDARENHDKAYELINKSINICKMHELHEQLQRGYMSLGSLLFKSGDNKRALQQYNFAAETAKKLKKNPELLASTLLSKSQILCKLGDFRGAKNSLKKAYRLKIPNVKEQKNLEINLRCVASICIAEDNLVTTNSDDYIKLKSLYEKLGDGASELKLFDKALCYYKKMLEAAEKAGMSSKEIATCYYSIAETYKDNGQYAEAIEFFEKELALCGKILKDGLNTLSKIADTMESANFAVSKVEEVYTKAISECRKERNKHEEGRMVRRFIDYLRRENQHSQAFHWNEILIDLDFHSSDTDDELSEGASGQSLGKNLDLDALSDDSEDSNTSFEQTNTTTAKPRRRTNFQIKRNLKGETDLHKACINGKMQVVQHLLEQGHPVNTRDYCGWLPIHEACICGHKEIVELLLEKGAAINDRGGSHCGGITPLHDAASNGHLEVLHLLLNRGANAIAKTDDGESVLDFLAIWRSQHMLETAKEQLYQSIVKKLSDALEKSGHQSTTVQKPHEAKVLQRIDRNRSHIGLEDDLEINNRPDEYVKAMETLRHRPQSLQKASVPKQSALVLENEVVEDGTWLEDDVIKVTRKRKTASPYKLQSKRSSTEITDLRKSKDVGLKSPRKLQKSLGNDCGQSSNHTTEYAQVMENLRNRARMVSPKATTSKALISENEDFDYSWLDDDFGNSSNKRKSRSPYKKSTSMRNDKIINANIDREFNRLEDDNISHLSFRSANSIAISNSSDEERSFRSISPVSINSVKKLIKNKRQVTLNRFGLTRDAVEADSTSSPSQTIAKSNLQLFKTTSFDSGPTGIDPTVPIDVKIDGKLYRVPVLMSQINILTIKWLADEAAARYAKKEYVVPLLELQTKNGALLANDDLLSLLFPMGSYQAEEVEAKIIKWNLMPLLDRYKDACQDLELAPLEGLCNLLQECSITLNLSYKTFNSKNFLPVFKVINRQTNLRELNLSGNILTNDCIEILSLSLKLLKNLEILNLSSTNLSFERLNILATALSNENCHKLRDLDFSDNYLSDDCFKCFKMLADQLRIKQLNLSNNNFKCYKSDLILKYIEDLDISDNNFNNDSIQRILSNLDSSIILTLKMSRNSMTGAILTKALKTASMPKLTSLQMSRCRICDADVEELIRSAPNLEVLDISYNNLSALALQHVVKSNISSIDLTNCLELFEHLSELTFTNKISHEKTKTKIIKISKDDSVFIPTLDAFCGSGGSLSAAGPGCVYIKM